MMRSHIDEDEEHTIARFLNGLNYPIQNIVEFQPYTTIVQLVHQATKAERQVKKEAIHERTKAYYADKKTMHDGHNKIYSFKVHDKTFVLKTTTPSQII